MNPTLETQIEAILFYKAEPVKVNTLAKTLNVSAEDVQEVVTRLEEVLTERGLQIVHKDNAVLLTTAASVSSLIESIHLEELEKELSKAALETLSVILYHSPVTRSDIDYIRGVNSSYMLRTLLIRGLVERRVNPQDKRGHVYQPTFDLLQHLGVSSVSELPEYETVQEQVSLFVKQSGGEESSL